MSISKNKPLFSPEDSENKIAESNLTKAELNLDKTTGVKEKSMEEHSLDKTTGVKEIGGTPFLDELKKTIDDTKAIIKKSQEKTIPDRAFEGMNSYANKPISYPESVPKISKKNKKKKNKISKLSKRRNRRK